MTDRNQIIRDAMGKSVRVIVDRPIGYRHGDIVYPINYGYIPGIIASYSYAMTPYILAENPGLRANEAISRSKEMMDGYKGELFLLHLTFIGWDLLAVLTLNIGHLWLNPYKHAAEAAFYRQLQAKQQTYIA